MREKDIRERIHIFLRDTVRYVVVPASMGSARAGGLRRYLAERQSGWLCGYFIRPGRLCWGRRDCRVHGHGGMTGSGGETGAGGTTGAGGATGPGGATGQAE